MLKDIVIQLDESERLVLGNQTFSVSEEGRVFNYRHEKNSKANKVPALYKIRRLRQGGKEISELKPHPMLAKVFAPLKHFQMPFLATELPMVAPPTPRLDAHTGGYFVHPTEVVRIGELPSRLKHHYMSEINNRLDTAKPLFDSLNLLSSTPWMVLKSTVFSVTSQHCLQI